MKATPSPSSWSGACPAQSRRSCRSGAACPAAPWTDPPGRPTAPAGCAAAPPGPGGTARTWRPWQPGSRERQGRSKRPWRCSPGSQGPSPRVPGASPVSGLQRRSWCPLSELSGRGRKKKRFRAKSAAQYHSFQNGTALSYSSGRLSWVTGTSSIIQGAERRFTVPGGE